MTATKRLFTAKRLLLLSLVITISSGLTTQIQGESVTLIWYPPETNVDGTPLLDLVGYNLYYGLVSRRYTTRVFVEIPELTISDLSPGRTYYFAVTAVNSLGIESDFSEEVVWSVPFKNDGPIIVTQPQSVTITAPAAASFSVVAAGDAPLTYQWRRDGVPITGAESSTYTHNKTSVADNGARFDVVVQNPLGIVTSTVAVLTVQQKLRNRRPKLVWEPVEGAEAYYLWLARNGRSYRRQWISAPQTEWESEQDLPGGSYTWRVCAWYRLQGYGPWSEVSTFTIAVEIPSKLVQIAPVGAVSTNRPLFIWTADDVSTRYQFRLTRNGRLMKQVWVEGTNELQLVWDLPVGHYRWWIRGWTPDGFGPWSDGLSFSYGIPVALLPTGVVSETRQPEFVWSDPVNDSSGYCLQLFRNGVRYRTIWINAGDYWRPEEELRAGTYRWWIKTWNSGGYGPWTRPVRFTIPAQPPAVLVPLAPQGEVTGSTISYSWQADPKVARYQLQITTRNRQALMLWVESPGPEFEEVSVELSGYIPGNTYTWWVRGWNADGFGPWSEPMTFLVR
ncbi:MAG: fibronectin type III domain-containing protein [Kiritimatiellia bacterium]